MPDMAFGHDEVVIAYACATFGAYAAVDDHILADGVVVADIAECGLSVPAEILRIGADDGALVNAVVLTHACARYDRGIRHYLAPVADLDVLVDICEWVNGDVGAELGRRINVG